MSGDLDPFHWKLVLHLLSCPGNIYNNFDFYAFFLFLSYKPVCDSRLKTDGQDSKCGLQDGRMRQEKDNMEEADRE